MCAINDLHIINKILLRNFCSTTVLFSSEVSRFYLARLEICPLLAFDAREEEECLDTCSRIYWIKSTDTE